MKLPFAKTLVLACAATAAMIGAEPVTEEKKPLPRIVLPPDAPAKGKTAATGKAATPADAKASSDVTKPKGTMTKTSAKKEEEPKIEGVVIPRGKGFIAIQILNSAFKLSFYDEKKKPVAPDVDRAALRWDPRYKVGEERAVLLPSADGKFMTAEKNIRPPHNFKLYITLIKDAVDGKEPINETFPVDFRQ